LPVIDRRCPLDKVPEALEALSKGLVKGKVVITVDHEDEI
jgi:D-arabinose 1-dehydrogenase-like Zn-dependent alcohol dehydrogenase